MKNQISLVFEVRIIRVPVVYASFSIHQKINYKANQRGLHVVFKSFYNHSHAPLVQPEIHFLTKGYFWHYSKNSGGGNRLASYRAQLSPPILKL